MDFTKIQTLLVTILGLVFLLVAIKIAMSSRKAKYADTARTGVNGAVAMVFVAIGLGAIGFAAFGTKILDMLGIS